MKLIQCGKNRRSTKVIPGLRHRRFQERVMWSNNNTKGTDITERGQIKVFKVFNGNGNIDKNCILLQH